MAHSSAVYAHPVSEGVHDIAIIGTGAAGLMAGIAAGREAIRVAGGGAGTSAGPSGGALRIIALDSARTLGAKILVAGGGRCNVTHNAVNERDYHGSTPGAIRTVLRRFGVPETVAFFEGLGVALKREETGKLFPTTDSARTVLAALLGEAARVGVRIKYPWRVEAVEVAPGGFLIRGGPTAGTAGGGQGASRDETPGDGDGTVRARRVIIATGGMALPKSGSDGHGYSIVRSLGHTTTGRIFPALVPLTLADGCFVRDLSGLAAPASLEARAGTGKRLARREGSMLCAHFGISGPVTLDISREYLAALHEDSGATLVVNWAPGLTTEALDALLAERRGMSPARALMEPPASLPERLARALCAQAGVNASATGEHMPRGQRRALAQAVTAMPLPVTGHRGFVAAETTAGGVPLAEVRLDTMESRVCPGLHLCGEILDVDGRIGGFNFQWAWASGYAAGTACAALATGSR